MVADGASIARSTSSRRYKTDIAALPLDRATAAVMALQPVTYRGTSPTDPDRAFPGFIAEDVAQVEPLLATYDQAGAPDYVTYDRLPVFLVPVVQDHARRLAALEARLA